MIVSSQLSGVASYSSAYQKSASANSAVLHTSLKNPLVYSDFSTSTDPAAAVYDLVVNGHMRELLEKESTQPSVTLAGRVVDRIVQFFWKGWTKDSKRTVNEEQAIVQANPLKTEEQTGKCPNTERVLFEITNCPIEVFNECLCFQFPVGCNPAKLDIMLSNGTSQLTMPVYYYTARAFAFGEDENGCAISNELKLGLLSATEAAISVAGHKWQTGNQTNYKEEIALPEFDGTSWKVALAGERDLNTGYLPAFTDTLLYIMNIHEESIIKERDARKGRVMVLSMVGGLVAIMATGFLIYRCCNSRSRKPRSDEHIKLNQFKNNSSKVNPDIV
jgi:hypothetical protein